jgi:hypothetical protein
MRLWIGLLLCQAVAPAAAGESTAAPHPGPAPQAEEGTDSARDDYLRQDSRLLFELNAWGDASLIGSGLAFLAARGPFARGFELQTAVWGLGAAATAVYRLYQRKHHPLPAGSLATWAALGRDARRDHRVDAGIDLALLLASLAAWRSLRDARWRGMAAGIALQCGFLGLFNLLASLAFRA